MRRCKAPIVEMNFGGCQGVCCRDCEGKKDCCIVVCTKAYEEECEYDGGEWEELIDTRSDGNGRR